MPRRPSCVTLRQAAPRALAPNYPPIGAGATNADDGGRLPPGIRPRDCRVAGAGIGGSHCWSLRTCRSPGKSRPSCHNETGPTASEVENVPFVPSGGRASPCRLSDGPVSQDPATTNFQLWVESAGAVTILPPGLTCNKRTIVPAPRAEHVHRHSAAHKLSDSPS